MDNLRRNILVVDDDPVARTLIGSLLGANGYDVHTAEDSYSAVVAARTAKPDAVVLDFRLPGGGALVVIDRLRRLPGLGLVPIVVVSAAEREMHGEVVVRAGASTFIQKPFEPGELLDALSKALSGGTASAVDGGSVLKLPS